MPKPIEPPRSPRRGAAQELRSQLFLELMLNGYAILGAAILLRCLLLSLRIDDRYWIGSAIIGLTDTFAKPLSKLPGAGFTLVGRMTMVDLTLLGAVVLFPIGIYARPHRTSAPL